MKQDALIIGLRSLAEGLNQIADALTEENEATPETKKEVSAPYEAMNDKEQAEEPSPAAAGKTYSYEEVRGILGKIAHDGHRDEVKALVLRHGGNSIKSYQDQPDILAELVKEAEELSHDVHDVHTLAISADRVICFCTHRSITNLWVGVGW